jgi:ribosomal protein S18 acetylase RimI-like enzyme
MSFLRQTSQMNIRVLGAGDEDLVQAASHLFDAPAIRTATARFLSTTDDHLLIAYEGDRAVGFISGVEVTHPDKGTEMFIYELATDVAYRRRGIAGALIDALKSRALERGCYGMWVLTDEGNDAALATYVAAAGVPERGQVVVAWNFLDPAPSDVV